MNEYENIETVEKVDQGTSLDVSGTDDSILSDSVSTESDMVQDAGSVTEEPPTESVDSGESGTNVYVMVAMVIIFLLLSLFRNLRRNKYKYRIYLQTILSLIFRQ